MGDGRDLRACTKNNLQMDMHRLRGAENGERRFQLFDNKIEMNELPHELRLYTEFIDTVKHRDVRGNIK